MAKKRAFPRILLVEGKRDSFVIAHLIEANGLDWGSRSDPLVHIEVMDGDANLLSEKAIESQLRSPGLESLGIVIDADDNPTGRWTALTHRLGGAFADLPPILPEHGWIGTDAAGLRAGVWVMPDNASIGMIETFLARLRPEGSDALWDLAVASCDEAHRQGAPYSLAHRDKALLHCWLAWQAPPGQQIHEAVLTRTLAPESASAQPFVTCFRALYQL